LVDLGGPDVESLQMCGVCLLRKKFGENACLVAPAASDVEERKVFLFGKMGVQKATEIRLQSFEVLLKEFGEWSVGHGRNVNLGFGFWNFEIRLWPWIYRFDQDVTEKARD